MIRRSSATFKHWEIPNLRIRTWLCRKVCTNGHSLFLPQVRRNKLACSRYFCYLLAPFGVRLA